MVGKKYNKSPIAEALIDFKIDPLVPKTSIEAIRNFHDQIKDQFPEFKNRYKFETKIPLGENSKTSTKYVDHGVDGIQFWSSDKKEVLQYRLDGYTFSRLKPYKAWETHFPKAIDYWKKYLDIIKPQSVKRIAVRYVNQIDIPEIRIKLEDYLTNAPSPPEGLPQDLDQFLTNIIIKKEDGIKARVTRTMQPSPSSSIRILLDIDVFLFVSLSTNKSMEEEVVQQLEKMHLFAEEIFERSLTEKTKELFD